MRNRAPSDVQPWAGDVDRDLDFVLRGVSEVRTNVDAALASASSAATGVANVAASGNVQAASWSTDITVGAGWMSSLVSPVVINSSPTGRLEIQYGGAIRNGSARICYQVTNYSTGSILVSRLDVFNDAAQALALTGSSTFPASAYRTVIASVPPNTPIRVTLEVNGLAAGVVLSGSSLTVRPTL